jgi:Ca2+/H+ antiporter, TMEM165/GDT1 family
MLEWSTAAPAIGAAFLASLVEVVEAFTIVLVVATLRGWKPAVLGTGAALATLAAVVVILGPLLDQVPLVAVRDRLASQGIAAGRGHPAAA